MMKWIVYCASVCWLAALGLLAYWQWFDNPVIYHSENIVVPHPIKQGDELVVAAEFCENFPAVAGTVTRSIVDSKGVEHLMPMDGAILAAGCFKLRRGFRIPTLPPGRYTYHFRAQFQINPIRSVTGSIKPVPFEIIN